MPKLEKPIPKLGEVPVNLVVSYMKFYEPDLYNTYVKAIEMPFDSVTSKTKYAAFAILLTTNLMSISSLFHPYPWLRTLGLLMGLLSSIAILLVTLTPVNDKPDSNDNKEIMQKYDKTYQECESKIIAKITENILIIKSILILESNPASKKRKLIEFYNEAPNEVEKELITYSMRILNQDLKLV